MGSARTTRRRYRHNQANRNTRQAGSLKSAVCEWLEERRLFTTTIYVTNTNDSGTGSLRQAIISADAVGSANIDFDLATTDPHYASGVFTIRPLSALPTITGSTINIDGNTQETYTGSTNSGRPVVYLDGGGQSINGLVDTGSNGGILNLGITDFKGFGSTGGGIIVTGSATISESIQGCWIGVAGNGTSAAGNSIGVEFTGEANDDFLNDGGTGNSDIVGGNTVGVAFLGASRDEIYNAFIGMTNKLASVPNTTGVEFLSNATYGGNSVGNYVEVSDIGFSTGDGVLVSGAGTDSNDLASNLIGVNYSSQVGQTGYYAAANGGDGVHIAAGASNTSIGLYNTGTSPSIIAGNTGNGVEIDASSYSRIQSSSIGEAVHQLYNGHTFTTVNAPNGGAGVYIHDASYYNSVGGTDFSAANVISANSGPGVEIGDINAEENSIDYNYIGTDSSSDSIGNAHEGVLTFGYENSFEYNVISANGYSGVSIPGENENVSYNTIGLNVAGNAALPNLHEGVYINGDSNSVVSNTISGNTYTGITVAGSDGLNNGLYRNLIGTDVTGTMAIPNQQQGVLITGTRNAIAGGVISGNVTSGVALEGSGNDVYDAFIGTNAAGTAAIPNGREGVYINSSGNTVGGNEGTATRNVISGNTGGNASFGVSLDGTGATGNYVVGNYIGLNAAGTAALGNVNGVQVQNGAYNNSIGEPYTNGGNVISGNSNDGIYLTSSATTNSITLNYIGTNAAGTASVANVFDGIEVDASNNTIGGPTALSRNVISGNSNRDGVVIEGSGVTGDVVKGNYIGTDPTGTMAIPNSSGVEVISGASAANISGNVISGNSNRGVGLFLTSTTSAIVDGNNIGTDYTGTQPLGNGGIGIYVNSGTVNIGGFPTSFSTIPAGLGDTVDYNGGGGINISNPYNTSSFTTYIDASTIANNSNGGINNAGSTQMIACTVTGNSAASGAGIYNSGPLLNVENSTIALNDASSTGGGIDAATGFSLTDDIVALNTGGDITGAVSGTYNLIGDGTGLTGITNGTNANIVGTHASPINPLLGPLTNNGGFTQTMAPEIGSPALGAGANDGSAPDQRGVPRPAGAIDIGSVQRMTNSVAVGGAPAVYLRMATDGQTLDIYLNNTGTGTPASTYLLLDLATLTVTGTAGNDQLTIDYSNGVPIPPGTGFSYDGLAGTNTMKVIGTTGSDVIGVNAGTFTFGSSTATYANVQTRIIDPGAGSDSVTLASGITASFPAATTGGGILNRNLSSLSLGTGSTLLVPTASAHSDRTVLLVQTATVATGATLNLGGNDADFSNATPFSSINGWLALGYASGAWTGTGIDSSTAAGDTTRMTALGVILNNQNGTALFTSSNKFDGTVPAATDVLVKFTYYGDANLDGKVDGSDYSRIDAAFAHLGTVSGWYNGDFNYDGSINGSDYTLIDNAFNRQGTSLAAQVAIPDEQIATSPAEVVIPLAGSAGKPVQVQSTSRRSVSPFASSKPITITGWDEQPVTTSGPVAALQSQPMTVWTQLVSRGKSGHSIVDGNPLISVPEEV